jgi:hypothetical protein
MISRRIIAAAAVLCALIAPVHAQKTGAQISSEITTLFPDNIAGQITAAGLRSVTSDLVSSIMPTAPVVSGNLACFNGTTGLLRDCGSAPTTVPLTIGTTPINSGTSGRVLFDNSGVLAEYSASQLTSQINLATALLSGALPAWPNNTSTFFRGDGTYTGITASASSFTPPEANTTPYTVQTYLGQQSWLQDWGGDPTGALDSGPAIRLAIDNMPYGSTLNIGPGIYLLNSCRNGAVFDFVTNVPNKGVTIKGAGWSARAQNGVFVPAIAGTVFVMGSSIPTTCDIYHMAPTDLVEGNVAIKDVAFQASTGIFGTPVGRHGIHLDGQATNGIKTLGTLVGGSGYVNGSYSNVPLTGGSGSGATANITVAGGIVTAVVIVQPGSLYAVANSLSASNTNLGGSGSGFTLAVSAILTAYIENFTMSNVFMDNTATGYSFFNNATNGGSGLLAQALISKNKLMQVRLQNLGDSNTVEKNVIGANATSDTRNFGIYLTQASGATNTQIRDNDIVSFNSCITIDQAIKPVLDNNECEIVDPNTSTTLKLIDIAGGVGAVISPTITNNTMSANVTSQNIIPLTISNASGAGVSKNRLFIPANFNNIVIGASAVNTVIDADNTYYVTSTISACGNVSDAGTASVIKCVLRDQYAATSQPAAPASGRVITWRDSTKLRLCDIDSSSNVGCTVVTGQLPGTATNNNANAGNVGEYVESVVASGAAVALTTATGKDITTISLTAGDWDVSASLGYALGATTTYTQILSSISTTLNTPDLTSGRFSGFAGTSQSPAGLGSAYVVGPLRFSLSATTTIHLVAQMTFATSTASGYGLLRARRVR